MSKTVEITFEDFEVKNTKDMGTVEVLMLRGEKGDPGVPTDAQVKTAVDEWLDDHPEAAMDIEVIGTKLVIGGN